MARSLRVSLVLALLTLNGTALQLAPDDELVEQPPGCPNDSVTVRGIVIDNDVRCGEFCVPKRCGPAMKLPWNYYNLQPSAEGSCAEKAFTVPIGKPSLLMKAPCEGVTMGLFRRPDGWKEPATPDRQPPAPTPEPPKPRHRCPWGTTAYKSIVKNFDGVNYVNGLQTCTTFCVPEGPCLGLVQMGALTWELGITADGVCDLDEYPVTVPVANATKYLIGTTHGGACSGMRVFKVSRGAPLLKTPERSTPALPAIDPAEGRTCGPDTYAFKAVKVKRYPTGASIQCTSYCVPDGTCLQMVQDGTFVNKLGITGEGTCTQQDFPEPVPMSKWWLGMLKSGTGAFCTGLTMHQFQTAPVTPEAVTPEEVTPEDVTPEEVTPEEVTPEEVTPEEVTPEAVTPEAVTPEEVTPEAVGA